MNIAGGPDNENRTSGSQLGEVVIEVLSGDVRPLSAKDITRRWQAQARPIPDVEKLEFRSDFFSLGDPIEIQLDSADVDDLRAAATRLKQELATYSRVDPMPTIETMSRNLGMPVGAIGRYILARWASSAS